MSWSDKLQWIVALAPIAVYALFILYVVAMAFKRAWPVMHWSEKALAVPAILAGVLVDWAVNMTVATVLFWDLPASWRELVTARLKRYHANVLEPEWRRALGQWICDRLDHFDPDGDHC